MNARLVADAALRTQRGHVGIFGRHLLCCSGARQIGGTRPGLKSKEWRARIGFIVLVLLQVFVVDFETESSRCEHCARIATEIVRCDVVSFVDEHDRFIPVRRL